MTEEVRGLQVPGDMSASTDPSSILAEVAGWVGFGDRDAALLSAARPHVRAAFPAVVERFYACIGDNERAREVLRSDAQARRLEASLADWLEGLFGGTYDAAYVERRWRIGRVHVQIGLDQRYMFAAMAVIRDQLYVAIAQSAIPHADKEPTHRALDRICDIELAIMLEAYRDAYTQGLRLERTTLERNLETAESEREQLHRKAAQHEALATIGTLTAGLAHEIRNPLNAAKLQLELIDRAARKIGANNRIVERVGLVNGELGRLSEMLDDFLALARQRHLDRVAVPLLPLFAEVVELEGPLAAEFDVQLEVEPAETNCTLTVFADRSKVKQVLVNLVSNAVEAMRDRGGRVHLRAVVEGEMVVVQVVDTGPGIPESVADSLFEPFVTTKEAGTGLGLSIVKRIVEGHGGHISHRPNEPHGTCISVALPKP